MIYDLVVVGAGPGGFAAAVEGARSGLKTALVERERVGGTCLNWGCIPTKLMLGATQAVEELEAQAKVRVASGEIDVDYPALASRKDKIVAATRKAMNARLKALKVDVFRGQASFESADRLQVSSRTEEALLGFKDLILATGTRPGFFPGLEPDSEAVLGSTGFLGLEEMPGSLIVVGAGFIGLELAQAASRMGAKIHIVDALERMAPAEDPEVSKVLRQLFKRKKWDIRLGVRVQSVKTVDGKAVLTLEGGDVIEADKALVAVGRRPNSEDLNLEAAGIATDKGFITVDENLACADNIYAVGDINGKMLLAHAANHQALWVMRRISGKTDGPYPDKPVPSILYGSPEVMRVGRMEHEEDGATVTKVALAANPMAQSHAATQGFVKVVWKDGRVIGVTAVGHEVSRFAVAATMIVQEGWTRDDAHEVIFPHPALDESLLEALLQD